VFRLPLQIKSIAPNVCQTTIIYMMEAEIREFAYLAVRLSAIAYNATNLT
jgi:hypothetical protein